MSGKLRVGIVGCGGVAQRHKLRYSEHPDVDFVSVYDINVDAATAFAKDTSARVADSIEQMIAQDKLDAVSVCTPPGVHLANCTPLLEAGVAVLCEKPLERDGATALKLAEIVRRTNTPFMIAYCHRFHGPVIELKKLIDTGKLGDPLICHIAFAGYASMEGNHRANPKLSGGGCLIDNGSHGADLFQFLVAPPARVTAMVAAAVQKMDIEDVGLTLMSTADGKSFGELTTSNSSYPPTGRIEWCGTKGGAIVHYWAPGQPELSYMCEGDTDWTPIDCSGYPDRFVTQIAAFVAAVRSGGPMPVTVDDGLRISQFIEGAYQSARDGRQIDLPKV